MQIQVSLSGIVCTVYRWQEYYFDPNTKNFQLFCIETNLGNRPQSVYEPTILHKMEKSQSLATEHRIQLTMWWGHPWHVAHEFSKNAKNIAIETIASKEVNKDCATGTMHAYLARHWFGRMICSSHRNCRKRLDPQQYSSLSSSSCSWLPQPLPPLLSTSWNASGCYFPKLLLPSSNHLVSMT